MKIDYRKSIGSAYFFVYLIFLFALIGCGKKDLRNAERISYTSDHKSDFIVKFPDNGAMEVSLEAEISVKFEKILAGSEIKEANFRITHNDTLVGGTSSMSDSSIVFIPNEGLKPDTHYDVKVKVVTSSPSDNTSMTRFYHPLFLSWQFVTEKVAVYTMDKRSSWVTDMLRDGNKIMQTGDYLYCYGGWTAEPLKSYNDIYRSNGELDSWEKMPDAPWEGRHTYGIGKIDSTLYVYGGDHLSTVFDVWKSTDGLNFSPVSQDLSSRLGPRVVYGACAHNGKLYVLGGQSGLELNMGLDDVWMTTNGFFWKKIATGKEFLAKNISGSVVSFNNKIWVLGGGYYKHPDSTVRWTSHIYNSPDGINWKREPDAPWPGRQYTDACVWDGKLWIVGGDNGANISDVWYMTKKGEWKKLDTPAEFEARHASGVGVYNDKLVIVAGNYHNDCWVIEKTSS